jgi:hypothetical protein
MNQLDRRIAKLEREAPCQDEGAEADREALRAEIAEMLARSVEPAIQRATQEMDRLRALSVDDLVQEMREQEAQEASRHPTKEPDIRRDLMHMERYPIVWVFSIGSGSSTPTIAGRKCAAFSRESGSSPAFSAYPR